ncbi:MAG TPA: hypothetical protein VGM34_03785 [Chlamydiales bacterium]|jgi:uncharacterized metal-binding protein YceD (DUF177 family)
MYEAFQVFIDRLKKGEAHKIEGPFAPDFLDVAEAELKFLKPVMVHGEAYLADEHLVVCLTASTEAKMPCAVCNEMITVPLAINHFYQTIPLEEIPSNLYDVGADLREALLIELPRTVECNRGKCPQRKNLAPYLRSEKESIQPTHFPFAELDEKKPNNV